MLPLLQLEILVKGCVVKMSWGSRRSEAAQLGLWPHSLQLQPTDTTHRKGLGPWEDEQEGRG